MTTLAEEHPDVSLEISWCTKPQEATKSNDDAGDTENLHHDQQPGVQTAFLKDIKALVTVLEEMENPFLEHSQDLRVHDTSEIMDTQVAETMRRIETLGEEQYTKFVTERLEQCATPVTKTLPTNKLSLFSRPPVKIISKQRAQLTSLKND